ADLRTVVDEVKRLLGMPLAVSQAEVVYGLNPQPGQAAILSRPILGVLAQLSLQIDVPTSDAVLLTAPPEAAIVPEGAKRRAVGRRGAHGAAPGALLPPPSPLFG